MKQCCQTILTAFLLFLVFSPLVLPISALDNGPVAAELTAHNVDLDVELHLWGYNYSLAPEQNIVQQAYRNGELEQYYTYIFDNFWAWNYSISYTIKIMNQTQVATMQSYMENHSVSTTGLDNEDLVTGRRVDATAMNALFEPTTTFTINIVNLSSLDANGTHWFALNPKNQAYGISSDFRNFVELSASSYLYDPTAFTPSMKSINAATDPVKFLNTQISTIVEQVVLGSPYASAFSLPSVDEFAHHFAQIVLINSSDADIGSYASYYRDLLRFKSQVISLMPFLKYREFSNIVIDVARNSQLQNLISSAIVYNGSNQYIVVDQAFSDNLKNIIRSNSSFYSKWPTGFYHMLNIMAFDTTTEFVSIHNSKYVPYDNNILGMAVVPAKNWYVARGTPNSPSLLAWELRALGQSIGLPTYQNASARFIPSVMSPYEFTGNTVFSFSSTDKAVFARKFAMFYDVAYSYKYTIYTTSFHSNNYDWIVKLDPVEHTQQYYKEAQQLQAQGNITAAARKYMDAYDVLEDAILKVNQNIRSLSYGTLMVAVLIGLYTLYLYIADFAKPAPDEARTQKNLPISWLRPKDN